jgi:hypothetical protein
MGMGKDRGMRHVSVGDRRSMPAPLPALATQVQEPSWNQEYYGVVQDLCWARQPQGKAGVEPIALRYPWEAIPA